MSSTSNTLGNAARTAYDLAFQAGPIIFSGGLFSGVLGGVFPIISVLGSLLNESLSSDLLPQIRFVPIPGATLISNSIGTYPFANTRIAANAVIRTPQSISLMMIAPVNSLGGYLTKLALFESIRSTFEAQTAAGGTFHVMTPSHIYFNCLMTGMTDITSGETKQQQVQWQIDFQQPLITQQDAQSAFNGMMSLISSGQKVTSSSWSDVAATSGQSVQGASSLGVFPVTAQSVIPSTPL